MAGRFRCPTGHTALRPKPARPDEYPSREQDHAGRVEEMHPSVWQSRNERQHDPEGQRRQGGEEGEIHEASFVKGALGDGTISCPVVA